MGAVLSPLLANIALHMLDQAWQGEGRRLGVLVRYTDDLVVLCATRDRAVALGFDSGDMNVRKATAVEIKEIAAFLELDETLAFCRSRKTAERVGAAIALGVHLRSSEQARLDRRVLSALGELLTDIRSSLIRYRAAEVLLSSPALVSTYADDLRHLRRWMRTLTSATWLRRRCGAHRRRRASP